MIRVKVRANYKFSKSEPFTIESDAPTLNLALRFIHFEIKSFNKQLKEDNVDTEIHTLREAPLWYPVYIPSKDGPYLRGWKYYDPELEREAT